VEPCVEQLHEYWSSQLCAAPEGVADATTPVVRSHLRLAHQRSRGHTARAAPSLYSLPSGITALAACPPQSVFASTRVVGLGLMMVWTVDGVDTWAAGSVVSPMRAARRAGAYGTRRTKGDSVAVVFDTEPGVTYHIRPVPHMYTLAQDAPAGSWFLTGTAAQLSALESPQ
jgi:hypothetical protein